MKKFPLVCLLLLLTLAIKPAFAAVEDLAFASAEEEERYRDLIEVLRCPKCTNSNLAGSDADIAADLRTEIQEQINEGRSDEEIKEFMTARYGDFVLYKPPLNTGTALLWFGPLLLLLLGFFIIRRMLRASTAAAVDNSDTLSSEEQQQLDQLLEVPKDQP